ncbi:MAG: hypothetical protein AB1704_19220 [Pseudomonadota bacterium]|uniref:hypothetical protein n=1 Tax=Burkholderiaceae TaxID=119060 RepID=UPI0010F94CE2|nr:hypothetical protein [Burkholderia sp. 4M9327F10]
MYRLPVLATSLLLATPAFAGQPASAAQPAAAATVALAMPAAPAASDKVYPPLPTLAMLPPASDDDDDPLPKPTQRKKKGRVQERKCVMPSAHMVVSDASRAYLGGIEKQLDLALAK